MKKTQSMRLENNLLWPSIKFNFLIESAKKKGVQLSSFEWRVLSATATIPMGQTRSYQWVAQKIGRPKAVRAVGQALGKNPFALIIPCHRVVRSDGHLGGYAGGLDKKKKLLEIEKEMIKCLKMKSA